MLKQSVQLRHKIIWL